MLSERIMVKYVYNIRWDEETPTGGASHIFWFRYSQSVFWGLKIDIKIEAFVS